MWDAAWSSSTCLSGTWTWHGGGPVIGPGREGVQLPDAWARSSSCLAPGSDALGSTELRAERESRSQGQGSQQVEAGPGLGSQKHTESAEAGWVPVSNLVLQKQVQGMSSEGVQHLPGARQGEAGEGAPGWTRYLGRRGQSPGKAERFRGKMLLQRPRWRGVLAGGGQACCSPPSRYQPVYEGGDGCVAGKP